MKVGDVVVPRPGSDFTLRCGSGWYTHAICVQVEPLVLVSELGDMRWSATVDSSNVMALCQAHPTVVAVAMKRFRQDQADGTYPAGQGGQELSESRLDAFRT